MNRVRTVELLKEGDRFEFLTARSEWADNCYLPHPQGVIVVAKTAFIDHYNQCRFGWRLEKFPNSKPQDWWGAKHVEVRVLERKPLSAKPQESPAAKKGPGRPKAAARSAD